MSASSMVANRAHITEAHYTTVAPGRFASAVENRSESVGLPSTKGPLGGPNPLWFWTTVQANLRFAQRALQRFGASVDVTGLTSVPPRVADGLVVRASPPSRRA